MENAFLEVLLQQGALGILCIGMGWGMKVLVKKNSELWEKYDQIQETRIAEREEVVKALVQSTDALKVVMEYLSSKRKRYT